jgi:hypothetical protein
MIAPSREPDGTLHSTFALWSCTAADCHGPPWPGATVSWSESTAYQGNGRKGNVGRDVFSLTGRPLYPYMGKWADGCEVTGVSGLAQVVEWKRGSDVWRSTIVHPGETYVVKLKPGEDNVLLETPEKAPAFTVRVKNCDPQPLSPPVDPAPAAPAH